MVAPRVTTLIQRTEIDGLMVAITKAKVVVTIVRAATIKRAIGEEGSGLVVGQFDPVSGITFGMFAR